MKQARFYKMQDNAIVDTGLIMNAQERWRTSRLIEECFIHHMDCDYIKVFENHEQVSDFILINSSLNTDLKANSKETLKMTETISIEEIEKKYSTKTEDPLITAMKAKSAKSWTKTEKKLANMVENFTQELNTIGIKENSKETLNMENTNVNAIDTTNTKAVESDSLQNVKAYELSIKTMNDTNGAIDFTIKSLVDNKSTLTKMKKALTGVTGQTAHLPISIKEDIKALNTTKTKAMYIDGLVLVKKKISGSIQLANEKIISITETAKPELNQEELDRLAKAVKGSLKLALDAHFQAGKLLSEALEIFKAAGKPAKDWLEWANLSCSVKKAQAYNLVKIWNDFGDVSEFKCCPMRVLNILVHTSKDVYIKIEEQAKALAKKGILDTKAVNRLIDSVLPKVVKPVPVKSNTVRQDTTEPDATTKVIEASISSYNKDQSEPELRTSQNKTSDPETTNIEEKDKLIDKLLKQNAELLARIEELTKAVSTKEETLNQMRAAYLPQFDESEPYLVLGISPIANKVEINKRYRAMAALFNAKTCPAGAKALKAAKDEMLKRVNN